MNHDHDAPPGQSSASSQAPPFWRSRYGLGLVVFGAVAAYFLLSEHRAHFLGALPYLLLLACPLMHVFMHHGRGGHGRHPGFGEQVADPAKLGKPNQGDPS
ncbi:MAG: DUF2933 domain-containing protein [Burkholderiaceae bacterium]|jgi:hypothetical protein|nr:DUF2933 domain-containing protein [Burkholderiaceae bacterium]